MGNKIENKDRVDEQTLNMYSEINAKDVILEYLLLRGEDACINKNGERLLFLDDLLDMALIVYRLKFSQTNKRYVSYWLSINSKRQGIRYDEKRVFVPEEIYNEAKRRNDEFRKPTDIH